MDDDHRELASEVIDSRSLLMCWRVLPDGSEFLELGNWLVPTEPIGARNDDGTLDPVLLAPSRARR